MCSPFEQYLGTNYVPSADDMVEIKKLLEDSDKEVQSIDRQLHILQEKKSKIQEYAEQHRALISPIRRLSRDILEEIFLACLPTDRNPCMSVTEAPMLLTQICSSWRTISLSTPRLWAAIHIVVPSCHIDQPNIPNFPDNYLSIQERLVELQLERSKSAARKWLDRSGACPLSISVYECQIYTNAWESELEHLLTIPQLRLSFITGILLPYLQRWSSLDLYLSRNMLQNLIEAGMTADSLKRLKGLHITYQSSIYHPDFDWLEDEGIRGLLPPNLTSLTFNYRTGSNLMILFRDSKRFWEQLTELNWTVAHHGPPLSNETFGIIRHCRALKSLKLQMHIYDNINALQPNAERIDLRFLTSLSLSAVPTIEFVRFVKLLNLPSLTTLHYEVRNDIVSATSQTILEPLSNLIRSFGDTLLVLQLYGAYALGSQDLMDLLQFTPYIKDLKLFSERLEHYRWAPKHPSHIPPYIMGHQNPMGDELLYALSPQSGGDELCPQLETLEFSRGMVTRVTERALKEFAKARSHAHPNGLCTPALRKICIPINAWKEPDGPEDAEKVLLGPDSAVYFKKMRTYQPESTLSPYGIKPWGHDWDDYDIHNEL